MSQSLIYKNTIKEELFCDTIDKSPCNTTTNDLKICFCLHRIKVKLNSLVEVTLKDEAKGKNYSYYY